MQILQFVNVPAGSQATLAHNINVSGRAFIPDLILLSVPGCAATADLESVTVTNNNSEAVTLYAWLEFKHSMLRAFGSSSMTSLTPQPFVASPGSTSSVDFVLAPPPTGDDDRALVQAAVDLAITRGVSLHFSAGTYRLSTGFVDVHAASNITIRGDANTIIEYPSDDVAIVAGGVAASNSQARSGFLLRNCENVTIEGFTFQGGNAQEISTVNVGYGIYATSSRGTRVNRANGEGGHGLFAQDAFTDDDDTILFECKSYGCRGPVRTCSNGSILACEFRQPGQQDVTGIGDRFTVNGADVTLFDAAGRFGTWMVGRYVKLQSATSAANNGLYPITAATSTTITFTNAAGVAELFSGTWLVFGGDKMGIGAGIGAITRAGTTVTFTASAPQFEASDLFKTLRLADSASAANNSTFVITAVLSPTQIQFESATMVAGAFSGPWSVDAYDNAVYNGSTYGSTHAVYYFAGRENVFVMYCYFENIRTVCAKFSGSSAPIRNVTLAYNKAKECGALTVAGADDSQEHTGFDISHNQMYDCATGRDGWSKQIGIEILGSRGTIVTRNQFYYTRNSIPALTNLLSTAGLYAIRGSRYLQGQSQPLETFVCTHNTGTSQRNTTNFNQILSIAVEAVDVGCVAKWRTGGTLTKDGTKMTLLDASGIFSQQDVGSTISLRFAPDAANNITDVVIETVIGGTRLTFENAAGVGGVVAAGTYRIQPPASHRGGICKITDNDFDSCAPTTVHTVRCLGPQILNNTWNTTGSILVEGCTSPLIDNNREYGQTSNNARIRLEPGTSWPIVGTNTITAPRIERGSDGQSNTISRGMGIGVGSSAKVNYPLLGKRGRCKVTEGRPELVFPYGSGHVDGDEINVNGVVYTYKAVGPVGNQFNSFAGLVALVDAQASVTCQDYGSQFAPAVTTQHFHVRNAVQSTVANLRAVSGIRVLNPTAFPILPNGTGGGEAVLNSRGEQDAVGPTSDKTVFWSPLAAFEGAGYLVAADAGARTLLQAGGYALITDSNNDGCCQVFQHNDAVAAQEFKVMLDV